MGSHHRAGIRPLDGHDIPRLVQLNSGAVPAVPLTTAEEFGLLLEFADHAFGIVVEPGARGMAEWDAEADSEPLAGFMLAMDPGGDYPSENYRWFEHRGTDSLYVDRIVIDPVFRGQGLGQVLYTRAFELAASAGRTEVTCEVNTLPPNPGSMRFHERLGFVEVGRQSTKGGSVEVALLAAPTPPRTAHGRR